MFTKLFRFYRHVEIIIFNFGTISIIMNAAPLKQAIPYCIASNIAKFRLRHSKWYFLRVNSAAGAKILVFLGS